MIVGKEVRKEMRSREGKELSTMRGMERTMRSRQRTRRSRKRMVKSRERKKMEQGGR